MSKLERMLGNIDTTQLRNFGKKALEYAPWIIGGAAIGAGAGYVTSEALPAIASGPYYVEQVVQNSEFMKYGGSLGPFVGVGLKYLVNKIKKFRT